MPITFLPLTGGAGSGVKGSARGGVVISGYALADVLADGSAGVTDGIAYGSVRIYGGALIDVDFGGATPATPAHASGSVYISGNAVIGGSTNVMVNGGVAPRGQAYGVAGDANGVAVFANGGVQIGGSAQSDPMYQSAVTFLVEPQPIVVCYVGHAVMEIQDRFAIGSPATMLYTAVTKAPFALRTSRHAVFEGAKAAHEQFTFGEAASFVVRMLAESGISFGTLASGDYRVLARAVSRLMLAGYATSYAEALQLLADALVFGELVDWMQLAGTADTLALGAKVDALYAAFVQIIERLVLNAQAAPHYTLTVLLQDSFVLGSQTTHEAEFIAQVADALGFAMSLSFDNGEFIAWVMNTESRGLTRYTNYPFNSFARIGGRYYGAHAGGIARLGGRDDMGEPIKAKLRLGMYDFGDRHLKSFSDMFIGMAASGQMLLKAIFVDEQTGEKNMAIYKVLPRPAGASRETRAKLGRGMKAVDWDFVLENVDGADFDLQSIQFYPTQLSRRTRG